MTINIKELRELESKMTPGSWDVIYRRGLKGGDGSELLEPGYVDDGLFRNKEDALAVAAFRNAMPGLLDELARLRAIVDKLPVTADGVPVVPSVDTLWVSRFDLSSCDSMGDIASSQEIIPFDHWEFRRGVLFLHQPDGPEIEWYGYEVIYSTEAAALAAMEAK